MSVNDQLTRIKNSRDTIRTKMVSLGLGASDDTLDELATAVNGIAVKTSSNMTTSGATVTAPAGYYKTAQSKSVSTATQATPSITVSSTGLITASATQSAGYVAAGTKSATSQLSAQAATTITPGTSNKTAVAAGKYTTGAVTVKGDANLKAENIKKGISIFGVSGSAESGGKSEEVTNAAGGKTVLIDSQNADALPSGYTRLQYIESTGTQYIDTGFVPNQDTRLEMVATPLSADDAGAGTGFIPYGAATGYNSNAFECYSASAKLEFNYDGQYDFLGTSVANKVVTISHNKNNISLTIAGYGQFSKTFTYQSFTAPYTLTLFGIHRSSVICGKSRLHSCKIYNNGTLVRDFVPAKNSGGTVGLYDIKNNNFYTNAGSGSFAAGVVPSGATTVSKVVLNNDVLLDLTGDTVEAHALLSGYTAHNALGEKIVGTASNYATGTFASSSQTTTMSVSGLNFKPRTIVISTAVQNAWANYGTKYHYLISYDEESATKKWLTIRADANLGMALIENVSTTTPPDRKSVV